MKHRIILLLTCLAGFSVSGQRSYTLKQALDYASGHSYTMRQSTTELEKARERVAELIATGFPQINGSASYQNFIKLPVQVVPAEFFGGEPGEFAEVIFGTKQNLALDVTASQLIFDGNYIVGLRAAREFVELSRLQREQSEQEVRKGVADAYFMVLVARENAQTLKETLENLRVLSEETMALYENGLVEETDAQQVALNYNNTETAYQSAVTQIELAETLLKFQMGLPVQVPITLSDSLAPFMEMSPEALLFADQSHTRNIEFLLARQVRKLQELELKSTKSAYLPTINAFFSVQENAYRNEFDFFDGDKKFFPTRLLGVNVSVPIFSSFRRSKKVKQSKLELHKSLVAEEQAREGFKVNFANDKARLKLQYKQLNNEKAGLELAESIRTKTQIKFREGVAGSFDVSQAEGQYLNAQGRYIRALLDYLQARTSFEKLLNNL